MFVAESLKKSKQRIWTIGIRIFGDSDVVNKLKGLKGKFQINTQIIDITQSDQEENWKTAPCQGDNIIRGVVIKASN